MLVLAADLMKPGLGFLAPPLDFFILTSAFVVKGFQSYLQEPGLVISLDGFCTDDLYHSCCCGPYLGIQLGHVKIIVTVMVSMEVEEEGQLSVNCTSCMDTCQVSLELILRESPTY